MNYSLIINFISRVVGLLGLSMIPPLILSFYYNENSHVYFLIPIFICLLAGTFSFIKPRKEANLRFKESILIVFLVWVVASLIGAIPFKLTAGFNSYMDAFFESLSGFTATGSTVLADIEILPKSILFWRAETHWLGGMGIIVLVLAIFPTMKGKAFLFEAEAPISPEEEKLLPRISDVAKTYWKIYVALTLLEIIFLLPVMSPFDAITHSFASIAGGGFSTKNLSVGYFDNLYIELVLSFFMIAGATSFILHYYAFKGNFRKYLQSKAFIIFMLVIFTVTTIIAINLSMETKLNLDFFSAYRAAFFQVVSIITTTGFASENFEFWPDLSQFLLIAIMFIGGMSASTSGSIKISRYEVLFRNFKNRFIKLTHPSAVTRLKIGRKTIDECKIQRLQSFFFFYIIVFVLSGLLITMLGNSPSTSFSAVAATLGNVGPGIGDVGPYDNFAHFSSFTKIILSFCMLVGRLEIWGVLLLLFPEFWKKKW
ncbi:MAG: TrkH family potassium uptake protein [Rhodothermaceae bacterium]